MVNEKGLVWEGSIYQETGKSKEFFGDAAENESYSQWFDSLKSDSEEFILQCIESKIPSFLGDNDLFYITILNKNVKILFVGCFTLHAQTLGLIEIPFYQTRFKEFLRKKN